MIRDSTMLKSRRERTATGGIIGPRPERIRNRYRGLVRLVLEPALQLVPLGEIHLAALIRGQGFQHVPAFAGGSHLMSATGFGSHSRCGRGLLVVVKISPVGPSFSSVLVVQPPLGSRTVTV